MDEVLRRDEWEIKKNGEFICFAGSAEKAERVASVLRSQGALVEVKQIEGNI